MYAIVSTILLFIVQFINACYLIKNILVSQFTFDHVAFEESYTCQLFLRYRREIFILGVLGFLKMTRSFPNIPEEVRSLPKTSEVFRRRQRSLPKAKLSRKRLSTRTDVS